MVMKLLSQKSFFVYKFSLPPNTISPVIMHWNEFYGKSEIIEVGQACMVIKIAKRFFNQNYITFHSPYLCLLSPTKRVVSVLCPSVITIHT